jgi:hypothetical protein
VNFAELLVPLVNYFMIFIDAVSPL